MSADNSIVVIKFSDGKCKVSHMQCVENLWWSESIGEYTDALSYTKVFTFFQEKELMEFPDAMSHAGYLYDSISYVEYGIITISCDKTWNEIVAICGGQNA